MAVTSRKDSLTVTNTQQQEYSLVPTQERKVTQRKNLVARWLKDENSQLYCKWVVED